MDNLEAYKIDLKGLKEGDNNLSFRLGNGFFEAVAGEDVHGGDVASDITVKRTGSVFEVNVHTKGNVIVSCDRCLDDMEQPVESDYQLVARLGEEMEGDEEVVVVPREDGMLDMAWPLYEAVALGLPLRHVHPEGQCNEEMARRLKELMVDEIPDGEDEEQPVDDRWAALLKLKDNENNK